jgi:hypothetical protein
MVNRQNHISYRKFKTIIIIKPIVNKAFRLYCTLYIQYILNWMLLVQMATIKKQKQWSIISLNLPLFKHIITLWSWKLKKKKRIKIIPWSYHFDTHNIRYRKLMALQYLKVQYTMYNCTCNRAFDPVTVIRGNTIFHFLKDEINFK